MLLVEQNASLALDLAAPRLPAGDRPRGAVGAERRRSRTTSRCAAPTSATETQIMRMEALLHQVFSGLANGGIYGSVALALVMIYQATHHINFAQGEMATFSTFIAWALIAGGLALLGRVLLHGRGLVRRRPAGAARRPAAAREGAGADQRDRLHRPAADLQRAGGLDLRPHDQGLRRARSRRTRRWRRAYFSAHQLGSVGVMLVRAARAVRVLPLHAGRPGDARGRAEPRLGAAGRHPRVAGCWRWAGAWRRRSARWPA